MRFEDAIEILLHHEGGYVNHANDPGGETNFGISSRSYPMVKIRDLTKQQAMEIYKIDFWDRFGVDRFPPMIRLMFLDCAVNQGPLNAVKILQESCATRVDGKLGPDTMRALMQAKEKDVLGRMSIKRLEHYTKNPNWQTFGAGWSKRLLHITVFCALFSGGSS